MPICWIISSSNNTNKLSPQELAFLQFSFYTCSNNTNKLSPQELADLSEIGLPVQIIQINLVLKNASISVQTYPPGSNNTNKLSPQELSKLVRISICVQIIQINLVLKNLRMKQMKKKAVQIIQINLVLKNLRMFLNTLKRFK